jgi:hypothetical protein
MPIDPSIILGVKPVNLQFQQPDPIEQYGKVASLQALLGQGQLQGMQIDQAKQGMADDASYRTAYQQSGGDSARLRALLQGSGNYKALQALDKTELENKKTQAGIAKDTSAANKSDFETQINRLSHGAALLSEAKDQASYDAVKRIGAMQKVFDQEALGHMPAQFDPNFVKQFIAAGMAQKDKVAADAAAAAAAQKNANDPFMANPIDPTKPIPNLPVQDYQIAKGRAGATQVNVNSFTPASEEAQKDFMKGLRARYDQLQSAPALLDNIEKAKALVPQAGSFVGQGADTKIAAVKFLNNNLGTNINIEGISSAEELRARLFMGVMDNLKKMDSQPSQKQQEILQKALGEIGTDPNALPRVLDVFGDIVKQKVAIHNAEAQGSIARGVKFPYDPIIDLGNNPPPSKAPQKVFDSMPDPVQYEGKLIKDDKTGIKYRAKNGKWVRE